MHGKRIKNKKIRLFNIKENYWLEDQPLVSISKGDITLNKRVFRDNEGFKMKFYPCKILYDNKTQSIDIGYNYFTGEESDTFIMEIGADNPTKGYRNHPEASAIVDMRFLNLYNTYSDIDVLDLIEKDIEVLKDFKNRYIFSQSNKSYEVIENRLYVNIVSEFNSEIRSIFGIYKRGKVTRKVVATLNKLTKSKASYSISKDYIAKTYVESVISVDLSNIIEASIGEEHIFTSSDSKICNVKYRNEYGKVELIRLPVEFYSEYHKWLSRQDNSLDVHLDLRNKGFTYRRRGEVEKYESLLGHYSQEVKDSFPSEYYSLHTKSGSYYEQILLTDMGEAGDYLWIIENFIGFNAVKSVRLVRFSGRDKCERHFPKKKYLLDKVYDVSLYNSYIPHAVMLITDSKDSLEALPSSPEAFELYCKWQGVSVEEWLSEYEKGYSGELKLTGDILIFKGTGFNLGNEELFEISQDINLKNIVSIDINDNNSNNCESANNKARGIIFTSKVNISDIDKDRLNVTFKTKDGEYVFPYRAYEIYEAWKGSKR